MPAICETFAHLDAAGSLNAKEIENILGLARGSGYRYFNGTVPDAHQLRHIFRHAPPRSRASVQAALLAYIMDGTGWSAFKTDEALDVNGDGQINTDDILDAEIHSLHSCAEALECLRAIQKSGHRLLDASDARVLKTHLNDVFHKSILASHIVNFLEERGQKALAHK